MKLQGSLMFAVASGLEGRSEAGAIPGATLDGVQDGDNVVSTVSGSIDLPASRWFPAVGGTPEIHPSNAYSLVGFGRSDVHSGIRQSRSFGSTSLLLVELRRRPLRGGRNRSGMSGFRGATFTGTAL